MLGSAVVYSGVVILLAGLIGCVHPIGRLGVANRSRAAIVAGAGAAIVAAGFLLPAPESRVVHAETHLDTFTPAWQFNETHALDVDAPPERVFDAIRRVRADEILLFRTLTWIRRGGRRLPAGILNAGADQPILDIATRTSFVWLADDPPHELVVGTVIAAPRGARGALTPDLFRRALPPGFVLATMNFVVTPNGRGGSRVLTETRVFATSPDARRRFAVYWRAIYPGSALIRVMWLRAIERRATIATQATGRRS
jgi:hypothetical protein